ncbi:MAG: hypothetical protein RLY57_534 [Candidatus Parcubacteria bacterium]|jgi:hypothetical protein
MKYYNTLMQRELTQQFILPYQDEIIEGLHDMRREVDAILRVRSDVQEDLARWGKVYPIGQCAVIRNAMLDKIHEQLVRPFHKGVDRLKVFIDNGGRIEAFWGIDKEQYFENAILIGTAVVDVANDTVDPNKDPIEFYSDHEISPLKIINTFEQVARIAEKYWNYDVYPNIYFPELAPVFPLLAIVDAKKGEGDSVKGLILMQDFVDLHERNITTVCEGYPCGLAYEFLFKSTYVHKRLSREMEQHLITSVSAQTFDAHNKICFRLGDNLDEVRRVFEVLQMNQSRIKLIEAAGKQVKNTLLTKIRVK